MNRHQLVCGLAALALCASAGLGAYPLFGEDEAGISRLEGYRLAQQRPGWPRLPAGSLLPAEAIRLHLTDYDGPDFDTLPEDADLKAALVSIFGRRDPSYAAVVVDIGDTDRIRWAGLRPNLLQNAGSVGKIICMLALFDGLARAFPDTEKRAAVLRDTVVGAGDWVLGDHHDVPRWDAAASRNRFGPLRASDRFTLAEWLDHAISASANGAGSVIWREAMLLRRFGSDYPLDEPAATAFFRETPKRELGELALQVILEPLEAAGLDTRALRQGSFWTGASKRMVPGTTSYATPLELARFMFRLEQGRLVDEWSSLTMKKFMYITKRRYRYVYAPELNASAAYFKSGSLYQCRPEEGYRCAKYMGNARNMMNSVATIESPAGEPEHIYSVALMSNVLKFNSAWDHSRLAAAIHEAVRTRAPVKLREDAATEEIDAAGRSD